MSCQYRDIVPTAIKTKRTLRGLREARGLSRRLVAAELGISERTLIRHEDGTTPLGPLHRRAYADYYGVAPEDVR